MTDPVIVAVDSAWHTGWQGKAEHEARFDIYGGYASARLECLYSLVSERADAAEPSG
ncbi:MAG: hypothetical protein ACHQ50_16565 [Fimbriimonadales bacterium]